MDSVQQAFDAGVTLMVIFCIVLLCVIIAASLRHGK